MNHYKYTITIKSYDVILSDYKKANINRYNKKVVNGVVVSATANSFLYAGKSMLLIKYNIVTGEVRLSSLGHESVFCDINDLKENLRKFYEKIVTFAIIPS